MVTHLFEIFISAWDVLCQMAPYLILGFLIAGVLSVWMSAEFVERHLGRPGFRQVFKAALFGIPVPLCSCSVIPVTASLRRQGASPGAVVAFLSSTPQTGVDSILVTHALLGPVFTIWRVAAALLTGLATGTAVNAFLGRTPPQPSAAASCCSHTRVVSSCCSATPPTASCCQHAAPKDSALRRILRYGFITLPRDLGVAILIGLLISGLLSALVPPDFFAQRIDSHLLQMLVALLIGLPIYVCSTASVPIAAGLIAAGMSPGAALVFLVTGPATNAATFTTVAQLIGRAATAIYLLALAVCALSAGFLLDYWWPGLGARLTEVFHRHESHVGWFHVVSAVSLLGLLAQGLFARTSRTTAEEGRSTSSATASPNATGAR